MKADEVAIYILDNQIYEIDPKPNKGEYARKRKLFVDSLFHYLATQCSEDAYYIEDRTKSYFITEKGKMLRSKRKINIGNPLNIQRSILI